MKAIVFKIVLTGIGNYAYKHWDRIYIIPIGF